MPLSTLAAACDRYGVSNQAVASIATAVLQDMLMMSLDSKSKVIDRSKVKRERHKIREEFSRVFVTFSSK